MPSPTQPCFYIPHGAGPCFFMDWNPPDAWDSTAAYLRGLAARLPARPRAILLVTAHWRAERPRLTASARPPLLFDYHGFPEHTYALQYPAPGAPDLAQRSAGLLAEAGFRPELDSERGWDHGCFIPLMLAFPDADVPVLQMSLLRSLDAAEHLRMGLALRPLRDEGVLIIGSGMSWHNMRGYGQPASTATSTAFDQWLSETVGLAPDARQARLAQWDTASQPHGRRAHPAGAEEHLLPLHVVAGAAAESAGQRDFGARVLEVDISAFRFG